MYGFWVSMSHIRSCIHAALLFLCVKSSLKCNHLEYALLKKGRCYKIKLQPTIFSQKFALFPVIYFLL